MNIRQYISSGILEQYALGLTSEKENQQIEQYLAQYPELRQELEAIELALESYAQKGGLQTPAGIRKQILEGIQDMERDALPNPNKDSDGKGFSWWLPLLLGLLLISAGFAFYSYQQSQALNAERDQLQSQLQQLQQDHQQLQDDCDRNKQMLDELRDPNQQKVILAGTDLSPQSVVHVYWNNTQQTTYLDIINLPPPPSGKQYQLWAIVDGTPTDMGVFEQSAKDLNSVPFIANPQAFAITLEDTGGSPTPTLDQLYVIGNLAG